MSNEIGASAIRYQGVTPPSAPQTNWSSTDAIQSEVDAVNGSLKHGNGGVNTEGGTLVADYANYRKDPTKAGYATVMTDLEKYKNTVADARYNGKADQTNTTKDDIDQLFRAIDLAQPLTNINGILTGAYGGQQLDGAPWGDVPYANPMAHKGTFVGQ